MKVLFVGGDFSDTPRQSGYIRKLVEQLNYLDATVHNGGSYEDLINIKDTVKNFSIVFWFANVPNEYEKIVSEIKKLNPKCILITSKNNISNKYTYHSIAGRMLSVKANLCLIFTKDGNDLCGTLIDPLVNAFCLEDHSIANVAKVIKNRVDNLTSYTRVESFKIRGSYTVPDDKEFFEIVRRYANTFHELIHAENTERFLGNLSFRCEHGFPSMRSEDSIYVSRRNVDKRDVSTSGMVKTILLENGVGYYGDSKPSVDTPIQLNLYKYYQNIRYMIHSHTYIEGAPYTTKKIPCGAMEEVPEIINMFPDHNFSMIKINLYGHGSIIMARELESLRNVKYIGRSVPEILQPKEKKRYK